MKTNEEKLIEVKNKIYELIPSLKELKFGCEIKNPKEKNTGYYIVDKKQEYRNGVTYTSFIVVSSHQKKDSFVIGINDLEEKFEIIGQDIYFDAILEAINRAERESEDFIINREMLHKLSWYLWKPLKPLEKQLPEVWEFLYNILIENK